MARDDQAPLFDKIWVVSLPGAAERRAHIQRHLPAAGLTNFAFFDAIGAGDPAVDAAEPEVAKFPPCFRCGQLDCGKPDCNNFLLPAQIAVFLTYRRLWRTIAEGDAARVLVVEDDVFFHSHTHRVFDWLTAAIARGQLPFREGSKCLLRLGWARSAEHEAGDSQIRAEATIRMSNPCHALTRDYARALIDRDKGIVHTADVFLHQLSPRPGEAFTIFPPVASELSWTDGQFASHIHPKAVHVDYLRSQGLNAAADQEAKRLMDHIKKKHFRPLLITGHPRCGTGYAATLCRQLGLDVGHEKVGADGISSWMFAVDAEANPYALDEVSRTRRALSWRHMIVPVRDLATAVASVMRDSEHAPPSYAFRREHIRARLGVDLDGFPSAFERAVFSVVGWLRIILLQNPDIVFRIEDQHEDLRQFLIDHGLVAKTAASIQLDTSAVNADKPYRGVRHAKQEITDADWRALSEETKREVEWYCRQFGYPSPIPPEKIEPTPATGQRRPPDLSTMFLEPSGWMRSRQAEAPQQQDGSPLPWFTYAGIELVQRMVRPTDRVFEYGAGYSTLWWQTRVRTVISVEHDLAWVQQLQPKLLPNVQLAARAIDAPVLEAATVATADFFRRPRRTSWPYDAAKIIRRGLEDTRFIAYATFIDEVDNGGEGFDFVIVDGMARRLCTWAAIRHLKADGVLILDNSNRSDYDLSFALLAEAGFRQIPCWGLVPGADFMSNTSFFVRTLARLPSGAFAGNSFKLPEY